MISSWICKREAVKCLSEKVKDIPRKKEIKKKMLRPSVKILLCKYTVIGIGESCSNSSQVHYILFIANALVKGMGPSLPQQKCVNSRADSALANSLKQGKH